MQIFIRAKLDRICGIYGIEHAGKEESTGTTARVDTNDVQDQS